MNMKYIKKNKIGSYGFIVLLSIILVMFYYCNVNWTTALGSMPDEAGYIYNASLALGYDWEEVFSNLSSYYGYGYSVLLIPLLAFCNSGRVFLQSVVIENIFFVLLIYFIQVYLMSKLLKDARIEILAIISMLTCLYPYLISQSTQVNCEVFLNLFFWIIACLLYKYIRSEGYLCSVLLGIAIVYICIIHIRAITITGVAILLIFLLGAKKKVPIKQSVIVGLAAVISAALLFSIKRYILNTLGTGMLTPKSSIDNVIDKHFLFERIKWIFNVEYTAGYFLEALSKFFYILSSTVGTFYFGINYCCKLLRAYWEENKIVCEQSILLLYFLLGFMAQFMACCLIGVGDTFQNIFYGRYYEYCIGFLMFLGIYYLIKNKISAMSWCCYICVYVLCGLAAIGMENLYVKGNELKIDTTRLVGISYAISRNGGKTNTEIFCFIMLIIVFVSMFFAGIRVTKKMAGEWILLFLLLFFFKNGQVVFAERYEADNRLQSDIEMADYIVENLDDNQEIFFLYDKFRYETFYMRMQVFLYKFPMHLILPEECESIPDNSYVIAYRESDLTDKFSEWGLEYIMDSHIYTLSRK